MSNNNQTILDRYLRDAVRKSLSEGGVTPTHIEVEGVVSQIQRFIKPAETEEERVATGMFGSPEREEFLRQGVTALQHFPVSLVFVILTYEALCWRGIGSLGNGFVDEWAKRLLMHHLPGARPIIEERMRKGFDISGIEYVRQIGISHAEFRYLWNILGVLFRLAREGDLWAKETLRSPLPAPFQAYQYLIDEVPFRLGSLKD